MSKKNLFNGVLQEMIDRAEIGTANDVDFIMSHLSVESDFSITRYVDYSLSLVSNQDGFMRIVHYFFNGTLIQRNYASLYLNRLGEWKYVKEAFSSYISDPDGFLWEIAYNPFLKKD